MKVSVIVPAYNAEKWIKGCLESIQKQTYKDIEIVVVNDGSTDNTSGEIPRGTNISVSHTTNNGAAAARNVGIEVSTGELVAFCDADDYMEPKAIEKMVKAINGVDMVVGSFRKFGEFEQSVNLPTQNMSRMEVAEYGMGNLKSPRSNQMLSGCWAKLYKRSLIGRFPNLTTAEDMAFNYDYLKRCENVAFLYDIVYNNRKRKGSLSTTFNESDKPGLFGFLEALRYVRTFMEEFYDEEELENAIDNSKVYHTMLYFTRICQQTKKPMREMLMELYP